jgi:hypothetical protein
MINLLYRIATGEDCTGLFNFIEKLPADRRPDDRLSVRSSVRGKPKPLVQAHKFVAPGFFGSSLGPAMKPSSDIDI